MNNLFFKALLNNKKDFFKMIICSFSLAFILGYQVKIIDLFFNNISLYVSDDISFLKLGLYIILFIMIILLNPIINSCFTYICKKLEGEMLIFLKEIYYNKLIKEELINFQSTEFLNKQVEIENGINTFIAYIMSLFDAVIIYGIYFAVVIAYLVRLKKELIVIPILLSISTILMQFYNYKLFHEFSKIKSIKTREINNYLGSMIDNECHKETRIRYLNSFFMKKYLKSVKGFTNVDFKYTLKSTYIEFIFKSIFVFSYILSIIILLYYVYKNKITIYSASSIIISMELLKAMIDEFIGYALNSISKNYGNSKAFIDYMNTEIIQRKLVDLKSRPSIELKNVDFKYPESEEFIFKNINLSINKGEFIAIVGENGSGKSTLTKLIQGLYIPTNGNVEFKDDTNSYNSKYFRINNMSSLFQDFKKYKLELLTNVAISDENINTESEKKTLDIMKKIDFKFDRDIYFKGFDTMLSKDFEGVDISIGQWQRIAILRCLYKDKAKILCFDEPTSAIDPLEEDFFYEIFKKISKNKTCIMVTHRMASLKYADRIIYLENGKVIDFTTHDNLMNNLNYKTMYESQVNLYK